MAFSPDRRRRYSGGGFSVLRLLLEEQLAARFPQLAATTLAAPLGLARSTFAQPLPEALRADAAFGHDHDSS